MLYLSNDGTTEIDDYSVLVDDISSIYVVFREDTISFSVAKVLKDGTTYTVLSTEELTVSSNDYLKDHVNAETTLVGDYATGYTYLGVATSTKYKILSDSNYQSIKVQTYANKTFYVIIEAE